MSDESLSSVLLFSCFMNFMNFSLFESLFETNFNLFVVRRALRGFIIPWQQMELFIAKFVLTSGERLCDDRGFYAGWG